MVHARIATLQKGSNQHTAIAAPSQAAAAALLNISVDSGPRARKVIETGTPELQAAVERSTVSVSAASDVAKVPGGCRQPDTQISVPVSRLTITVASAEPASQTVPLVTFGEAGPP
jgi:hypothetical protein